LLNFLLGHDTELLDDKIILSFVPCSGLCAFGTIIVGHRGLGVDVVGVKICAHLVVTALKIIINKIVVKIIVLIVEVWFIIQLYQG
jgi:hypothetical protein